MSTAAVGALLGAATAAGLFLIARHVWSLRRADLPARIAPYLGSASDLSGHRRDGAAAISPFPTLERIVAPSVKAAGRRLAGFLGGDDALRRRLERAGRRQSPEDFRVEQVIAAAAGLALALGLAFLAVATGQRVQYTPWLILSLCTAIGTALWRDQSLSADIKKRHRRMAVELPTIAELLAFSVAAGEGTGPALERIAHTCHGDLAQEIASSVALTRTGVNLVDSLRAMSTRIELPALTRFVDGVVVAVERGTPMAEVLRAQAVDVRADGVRELLASAGRREIAMLVPVVFLILPTIIVIAVFPGFWGLSLGST